MLRTLLLLALSSVPSIVAQVTKCYSQEEYEQLPTCTEEHFQDRLIHVGTKQAKLLFEIGLISGMWEEWGKYSEQFCADLPKTNSLEQHVCQGIQGMRVLIRNACSYGNQPTRIGTNYVRPSCKEMQLFLENLYESAETDREMCYQHKIYGELIKSDLPCRAIVSFIELCDGIWEGSHPAKAHLCNVVTVTRDFHRSFYKATVSKGGFTVLYESWDASLNLLCQTHRKLKLCKAWNAMVKQSDCDRPVVKAMQKGLRLADAFAGDESLESIDQKKKRQQKAANCNDPTFLTCWDNSDLSASLHPQYFATQRELAKEFPHANHSSYQQTKSSRVHSVLDSKACKRERRMFKGATESLFYCDIRNVKGDKLRSAVCDLYLEHTETCSMIRGKYPDYASQAFLITAKETETTKKEKKELSVLYACMILERMDELNNFTVVG